MADEKLTKEEQDDDGGAEGKSSGGASSTSSLYDILGKPEITLPSHAELLKRLNEAEEKADECRDKLLRQQAEMDNMHRRVERDIANAHKFALEKFVAELLPIVDSLERSLELASEKHALVEGVELTYKMFLAGLEKFGVKQLNPLNSAFNPEFHEAVSTQENADVAPGTILAVLQKGYTLNNRLVRPALVIVSKAS